MTVLELSKKLQEADQVFAVFSACTKMPYVVCDEETFDDEIFLYFSEDDALAKVKEIGAEGNPVQNVRIDKKSILTFISNLWTMGANCILVDHALAGECRVQLSELTAKPGTNIPEGQKWIENPSLHLTACQAVQLMRRKPLAQMTEDERAQINELSEEVLAHFSKSTFLVPKHETNGTPLLKLPNGDAFQPIFTDALEFGKFNGKNEFKAYAIMANDLPKVMAPEAKGFVLNPTGVAFHVNIKAPAEKHTPLQK